MEIVELYDSRRIGRGVNPFAEYRYAIRELAGEGPDEVAVTDLLAQTAPTLVDVWGQGTVYLPREDYFVIPLGGGWYEGVARYGKLQPTGASTIEFDTSGGKEHIVHSRETYKYPNDAPNSHNLIGNTGESVEGVDAVVPLYKFSETHYMPSALITTAYRGTLFRLTGRVNSSSFRGFQAGECLFLGASGNSRNNGDYAMRFGFAASPNVQNITIGDITGIVKKGWQYLTVRQSRVLDDAAGMMTIKPEAVYVHDIYPEDNFGDLGIG